MNLTMPFVCEKNFLSISKGRDMFKKDKKIEEENTNRGLVILFFCVALIGAIGIFAPACIILFRLILQH